MLSYNNAVVDVNFVLRFKSADWKKFMKWQSDVENPSNNQGKRDIFFIWTQEKVLENNKNSRKFKIQQCFEPRMTWQLVKEICRIRWIQKYAQRYLWRQISAVCTNFETSLRGIHWTTTLPLSIWNWLVIYFASVNYEIPRVNYIDPKVCAGVSWNNIKNRYK